MNKSSIKTYFKRHGYKPEHGSFRVNWQYCHKNGRHYRIRKNEPSIDGWVVDISDLDFDRWANSTEVHAVPFEIFIQNGGIQQHFSNCSMRLGFTRHQQT
jgi:hypothetical protein